MRLPKVVVIRVLKELVIVVVEEAKAIIEEVGISTILYKVKIKINF